MRIAIIGAGNVGATLGRRWSEHHEVCYGVRDVATDRARALVDDQPRTRVAPVAEAAAGAELVVLATPWNATASAIADCGDLAGKIVVDCTNPLAPGLEGLTLGHSDSAGEMVATWAENARVVKAFNTTGAANMAAPELAGHKAAMFVAGDDDDARRTVLGLAEELGFDPIDCGPLLAARWLEPLAMLWIHLAYTRGMGPDFAFVLLRR